MTPPSAPLNPIAQKVSSKPGLSAKVQSMLPIGMTLDQASKGFKNQGQFIAALHVSQNHGISFVELKTLMTGIRPLFGTPGTTPPGTTPPATPPPTGGDPVLTPPTTTTPPTGILLPTTTTPSLSLGQAVKRLKPLANADAAVTTAEHQASRDLGTSTSTTTSTTTSTARTARTQKHGK